MLVVGHFPHLPALLAHLLSFPDSEGFPAHGMVALERVDAGWAEIWRLKAGGNSEGVRKEWEGETGE